MLVEMPLRSIRPVEVGDLAAGLCALAEQVAGSDEALVLTRDGEPLAVLAPAGSTPGVDADLAGWEEWLREVRESLDARPPNHAKPDPLDKSLLGFDPASGVVGSTIGRKNLGGELRRLGVPVRDKHLLADVYAAILALCEDKEDVYDEDLRALAQELIAEAPQRLRLLAVTMTSSTGLPATAEVTMELGHGPAMRREHGDGPLDAAFKAIQRLTGLEPKVETFTVIAATPGGDAMAEAKIELDLDGRRVVGTGASTNAVEAGVHAYVNALNFLQESRFS